MTSFYRRRSHPHVFDLTGWDRQEYSYIPPFILPGGQQELLLSGYGMRWTIVDVDAFTRALPAYARRDANLGWKFLLDDMRCACEAALAAHFASEPTFLEPLPCHAMRQSHGILLQVTNVNTKMVLSKALADERRRGLQGQGPFASGKNAPQWLDTMLNRVCDFDDDTSVLLRYPDYVRRHAMVTIRKSE